MVELNENNRCGARYFSEERRFRFIGTRVHLMLRSLEQAMLPENCQKPLRKLLHVAKEKKMNAIARSTEDDRNIGL